MRLLVTTILLILTLSLSGQFLNEIQNNLAAKDLQFFQAYIDTLCKKNNYVKAYWEVQREIAKGFEERILIIQKSVPHKEDPKISRVYSFRVNLISNNKDIIFYDLQEQSSKKVKNVWTEYYQTLDKYQNATLYKKFQIVFFESFDANLNQKELFLDSIILGSVCNNGLIENIYIEHFIKMKDRTSLLQWAQSTNVEKQFYGVKGFYALKKLGVALKSNELKVIKNVLIKKGTIRTCSGCIFSRQEIKQTSMNFRF